MEAQLRPCMSAFEVYDMKKYMILSLTVLIETKAPSMSMTGRKKSRGAQRLRYGSSAKDHEEDDK